MLRFAYRAVVPAYRHHVHEIARKLPLLIYRIQLVKKARFGLLRFAYAFYQRNKLFLYKPEIFVKHRHAQAVFMLVKPIIVRRLFGCNVARKAPAVIHELLKIRFEQRIIVVCLSLVPNMLRLRRKL